MAWSARVVTAGLALGSLLTGQARDPDIGLFIQAASLDARQADAALERLAAAWRPAHGPLLLDVVRLIRRDPPGTATPSAAGRARARLIAFLETQSGQRLGDNVWAWRQWFWRQPSDPHPDYAALKRLLYRRLDPRFADFFPDGVDVRIRLDELDWGGIGVNGIPPLDHPKTLPAHEATYLGEEDAVFGVVSEGEARAYPKRILAWHELARDTLGGAHLTVVYCTLCGTVIPYLSEIGGVQRTFGTSGLLYRSNKLMFDEESRSLWSTIEGVPVIGPLAASGLRLQALPVVTTTWGEWRAAHPRTRVLSLETGHRRDYREGAAYRDYFATDRLMFGVARTDDRLENKAEVLALLVRDEAGNRQPVALAAEFLAKRSIHQFTVGGRDIVVLTTARGANRAYEAGGRRFAAADDGRLKDDRGGLWRQTEEALVREDGVEQPPLRRLPAHRVFWFAWYAQFPRTLLIT